MTTNMERAGLVARHVELQSVSLAAANLTSSIDPVAVPDTLELSNKYRARYEKRVTDTTRVYVRVECDFEAHDPSRGETSDPIVRLNATFLLVYGIAAGADYPEDGLEHFASLNGAYNAWPYWRELVQTVTGRVGLAGVVMPVFRPRVFSIDEAKSKSRPHAEPRKHVQKQSKR